MTTTLQFLADELLLGPLLSALPAFCADYTVVAHWQQGEFHHDYVLALREPRGVPGPVLVVSTNCNAGVKEVLCLAQMPERWALWNGRCPGNDEFEGAPPEVLDAARTVHWFDPCALLTDDARSEFKPAHRRRQRGGGWRHVHDVED